MGLHARLRPVPRRKPAPAPPLAPSTTSFSSAHSSTAPSPFFTSDDDQHSDEDEDEDAEDVFTCFLPHLFPDDAPQFHGDPGQHLLYLSPRYGELEIMVPSYPDQSRSQGQCQSGDGDADLSEGLSSDDGGVEGVIDDGRKLFAHFLWSSGMVLAESVERADVELESEATGCEAQMWQVKGEKVLELGAGAGLPSIVTALAGASSVTITDHPSSPALLPNGALHFNTKVNIPSLNPCAIEIRPHEWGTTLDTDPWAASSKGSYTRIIAADCYWMPSQHENLARTMKWFLAPGGKVWCIAGFHTGREIVAGFFETVKGVGLEIESIWERDLTTSFEDGEKEVRREWMEKRDDEGPENRMRWCVVAVLRHAGESC
ncbi:hypothetical protein BDV19DRAFT_385125 [Aspergillus venezuelensis]